MKKMPCHAIILYYYAVFNAKRQNMKHKLFQIEDSLKNLEKALDIKITVIDNHGCFHSEKGKALLGAERQSHQKSKVCEIGFCHKCIEHCRFEMNEKGKKLQSPFIHKCWKGVQELVVPLLADEMHYGSLFAGAWRGEEGSSAKGKEVPPEFFREFDRLEPLDKGKIKMLEKILAVYVRGMLSFLEEENSITRISDNRNFIIRNLIYKRASEKLRLDDMAGALHLSNSRTSHLVKKLFGKSFQELLLEERVKRAQTLLCSTDCTLSEISELIGFTDEYHFNRIFKRACGIPPGRYRKAK